MLMQSCFWEVLMEGMAFMSLPVGSIIRSRMMFKKFLRCILSADLLWYNPDKKHGVTLGLDSVVASDGHACPSKS